jgi:hypothetical protein
MSSVTPIKEGERISARSVPDELKHLTRVHLENLRASGLTDETIKQSGVYSADEEQVVSLLGTRRFRTSGLVFPNHLDHLGGGEYAQVRIDDITRAATKYVSPKGHVPRVYMPPGMDPAVLQDTNVWLVIVEGAKKALKAQQEGLQALALPGMNSSRTRLGKVDSKDTSSVPLPDFERIAWVGRKVVVVPDSDVAYKDYVTEGARSLAALLTARGAHVVTVRLPEEKRGVKVGLDDYLLSHSV